MRLSTFETPHCAGLWGPRDFRLSTLCFLLLTAAAAFAVSPTGTLPIVYITLNNNLSVDRYEERDATIYIRGHGAYTDLASAAAPLPLTIRGRGNWTWSGFDKKPYRLKFPPEQGLKLLGMHRSRHWALMAGADDYLGYLKNTVGYALSEHVGLPWTPHQVPVELVLNGDYQGLYFLTETVRIDDDRIAIHEQQDGETNAELITGGWLIEIDNYPSEGNITFTEDNGQYVMVTPHSPEILSAAQRNYITGQLDELNAAIYDRGAQPLEQILDITDAARYYLVQEIMEDCESYHGSCYLYKDRDSLSTFHLSPFTSKWHFGPVWDFGNAYDRHQERFIYDHPTWPQIWVEQLCQHEIFYQRVRQLWYQYRTNEHSKVLQEINDFVSTVSQAAKRDAQRWQNTNVCNNSNMTDRKREFLDRMNWRLNWLYSQWGEGDSTPLPDALNDTPQDSAESRQPSVLRIVNGQLIIYHNGQQYTPTGLRIR